jgi:hypothetical protein
VGGAFWGLVAGCLMLLLFRRRPPGPASPTPTEPTPGSLLAGEVGHAHSEENPAVGDRADPVGRDVHGAVG